MGLLQNCKRRGRAPMFSMINWFFVVIRWAGAAWGSLRKYGNWLTSLSKNKRKRAFMKVMNHSWVERKFIEDDEANWFLKVIISNYRPVQLFKFIMPGVRSQENKPKKIMMAFRKLFMWFSPVWVCFGAPSQPLGLIGPITTTDACQNGPSLP